MQKCQTLPIKPISIQLYTLREEAFRDFPNVLRRVADMGYKGVEPAGFYNFRASEFRRFVDDLGLVVSSTHSPWVRPDNLDEVIETSGILGTEFVITGFGASEFKDLDSIKRAAEATAAMNDTLAKSGLTLGVHNHAWEFEFLEDRIKHEVFAELCPDVKFELDIYWASNFGANDSVTLMRRFASRAPLLHIKDGPLVPPQSRYNPATDMLEVLSETNSANVAVGYGKMNIRETIAAMDPSVTQWLVVELDTCETDMFEAVEQSYRFLTQNGLAAGNK